MTTTKHVYKSFLLIPSNKETTVRVLPKDILEVYKTLNSNEPCEKILLLNMANAYTPGGQYDLQKNNAFLMGQEESLCSRTNLRETLDRKFYPIRDNEVLLTQGIKINGTSTFLDVISCPAIDMRYKQYGVSLDSQTQGKMYIKISTIFQVALSHGYTTLVLGALGCGGFSMPPEAVSKIFKRVINEYKGFFKEIIFAIKSEENHPKNNYNIFKNKIETYNTIQK